MMYRYRFKPFLASQLCCLAVLLSPQLWCQGQADSAKTYVLDPVVITATQTEALRSRVPNAVTVVSRDEIASSGEHSVLPLLSRYVPGVYVTERGVLGFGVSNGAAGTIMIRGVGGSPNTEVLVLTDGRPQMMGLMGHPLPDTYLASGVERVEVIRGPASLLYGTNAMGGVVNVIYEKPSAAGRELNAGVSYGSFNTQKYELGGTYGAEGHGIAFFGSHYETDGQRPYSSFNSNNGSLRGDYVLGSSYSLNADVNLTTFRTYDPGTATKPLIDNWVDITRGSAGVSLKNQFSGSQGALKAFFNWGRHDIYDGFHSTDNNSGIQLYQAFDLLEKDVLTVGADYRRYGGVARNQKTMLDYGEHFVNEFSLYTMMQHRFLDFMEANAGVRLNHHNLYGWETVPQIGVAVNLAGSTTIKANVGKGFRSPTIRELYLFPAPTATLLPERMWNYELGVLQSVGSVGSCELTGFVQEGSNMILTGGVYPNMVLSNSGSFTHRGIEFSATGNPRRDLELSASYTFLDPGAQTNANPRHKVHFGATWIQERFTASAGFQYIGKLYGDDYSRKPVPDYALVDARLTVSIVRGLSAFVAGENLLDRPYQVLYDYPMPGRTVFVGMNYSL